MNPLIEGALRAGLMLACSWFVLRFTRGRSASLRRLVLVTALFGTLLAPFSSIALPYARAAGLPAVPIDLDRIPLLDIGPDGDFLALPAFGVEAPSRGTREAAAGASSAFWLERAWPIAAVVWGLGTAVLLVRLVTARAALRRLLRVARPAAAELETALADDRTAIGVRALLLMSESVGVPLTAGVLRPVIVLPSKAASWPEELRSAVMRHELAHVRQRDSLAQLVAELACAVHFFNPLVWWARRQLEIERELSADELVIQSGLSASSYADALLAVAAEQLDATPGAALGVARRSGLAERVERLATSGARALPSRAESVAVAGIGCSLLALVACASPAKAASSPEPASSASSRTGVTTIDPRLQRIADEETSRAIAEAGASTATVIVIDPGTGQVLAMAHPETATRNYAPGSTLKTLLIAAALDDGKLSLEQTFDCGSGFRDYPDGRRLRDHSSFGVLGVSQILIRSSNVGASRIYDLLGGANLADWFSRFHLDEAPAIAPSGTPAGSSGDLRNQPAGNMRGAVGAMGQAVATSPLHMAALYAAIANDGVYIAPTLVREQHDESGKVISGQQAKPERLLRPETARATLGLLIAAVEDEHATGRAARIDGIVVAGKTGTAQVWPIGGVIGENDSASYASFIGIVPASAPRYVILVGVEGKTAELSGGKVAAPTFARVTRRILAAN
jgi:beta-lactamase regulating signal transducer with metallopeptidase domain